MLLQTRRLKILCAVILLAGYSCVFAEHHHQWSLGALVSTGSQKYIGGKSSTQVLPVLKYESLNWSISTVRAEYHQPFSQYMWADFIAAVRLQSLDSQSSQAMSNINDRTESLDAGLSINAFLPHAGFASLEWLTDASDIHKGQEYTLAFAYPVEFPQATIVPSVFTVYQSKNLVDYYYGIKREEIKNDRPLYSGRKAFNYGLAMDLAYKVNQEWRVESGFSITRLGAGITSSPIIDTQNSWQYHMAVSYQF